MRASFLPALALLLLPACAHGQGGVLLQKPIIANNCSTFTGTNLVKDSGVGCSNHQLTVSDGAHGSMLLAPSTVLLPNSPAILNTTSGQPLLFIKGVASTSADGVDFDFRRLANYSGGTFGNVNSAARYYTVVSAGADSFEWPLQCVLDNSALVAGNSQDVCGYFQSIKRGTAATWAYVDELIDLNADPVAGSVTAEHDLRATGTDVHNQRVMADYFATSQNGAAATVTYGIRLNTDGLTTITHGLTLNGNYGTSAINIPTGSKFCWNGLTCTYTLAQTGGTLTYTTPTGGVLAVTSGGALSTFGSITTGGNVQIPTGQKLTLDGTTGNNYLSQSGGTVSIVAGGTTAITATSSTVGLGLTTALALNTGTGPITGGAITSTSETSSGTVQGATLTTTGNVNVPTSGKVCLNGASCTTYISYNGSVISFFVAGTNAFSIDATGQASATHGYSVATTPGVNCLAGAHQTVGGITVIC